MISRSKGHTPSRRKQKTSSYTSIGVKTICGQSIRRLTVQSEQLVALPQGIQVMRFASESSNDNSDSASDDHLSVGTLDGAAHIQDFISKSKDFSN